MRSQIIGVELFAAINAPITARLAAKQAGLAGVLGMWWNAGEWELAGAVPLLSGECVGASMVYTPNRNRAPAPFPSGTPVVFDFLCSRSNSAFDSIQTGTSNPVRLYVPPRSPLRVTESAHAAVLFSSDNTAQVGFPAGIGDPTPANFADYPIRIEVTNVSPLRARSNSASQPPHAEPVNPGARSSHVT